MFVHWAWLGDERGRGNSTEEGGERANVRMDGWHRWGAGEGRGGGLKGLAIVQTTGWEEEGRQR